VVTADLEYVRRVLAAKLISGPVLELGAGYGGLTTRELIEADGHRYYATDLAPGPGVDFAGDFERPDVVEVFREVAPFGSVLILNVLEHTFDPIRVLDNAVKLLRSGGSLVVLTPAVWPLHNFPMDVWRILPNFYEEYAKRRSLRLLPQSFEFIGYGPIDDFAVAKSIYAFPKPGKPGLRRFFGRAIHKAFNTFGRSMAQPSYVSVAAVFQT